MSTTVVLDWWSVPVSVVGNCGAAGGSTTKLETSRDTWDQSGWTGFGSVRKERRVQSQAVAHATPSHQTPEIVAFNLWLPPFLGGTVAGQAISHISVFHLASMIHSPPKLPPAQVLSNNPPVTTTHSFLSGRPFPPLGFQQSPTTPLGSLLSCTKGEHEVPHLNSVGSCLVATCLCALGISLHHRQIRRVRVDRDDRLRPCQCHYRSKKIPHSR